MLFQEDSGGDTIPTAIGVEFLEGNSLYRADPRSGSSAAGTKHRVLVSREVILSAWSFQHTQLLKLSGVGPKEELEKFGIPVVRDLPGVGTNLQDRYEVPIVSKLQDGFRITARCTFGKAGGPRPPRVERA